MSYKRRHKDGSNLIEYVIPMALVGIIVGVGLYQIISSGVLRSFIISSNPITYDQSTKKAVISQNKQEEKILYDTLPHNEEPIFTCAKGLCDIDFGDFILTGIPENFEEFVKTQGTAGGTEELIALLEQIAAQLEEKGDNDLAAEIRDLANLGHIIAQAEKKILTLGAIEYGAAGRSKEGVAAFQEKFQQIATLDYNYPNMESLSNYLPSQFTYAELASSFHYEGSLSNLFNQKLQTIKDNPNLSDKTKQIVSLLALDINQMSLEFSNDVQSVLSVDANSLPDDPCADFLACIYLGTNTSSQEAIDYYRLQNVVDSSSKSSTIEIPVKTNFKSALICVNGKYKDTGLKCK